MPAINGVCDGDARGWLGHTRRKHDETSGEGVRVLRHGHELNMIRHEAVAEDGDATVTGIVLEELEVQRVVFGPGVVLLVVVTALVDVAADVRQNQARDSGHKGDNGAPAGSGRGGRYPSPKPMVSPAFLARWSVNGVETAIVA
jgi:hypothetical protein